MYKKYSIITGVGGTLCLKILLTMRITMAMFILAMMPLAANSKEQQITINQQHVSLESVLKEIRKQSGYDLIYDGKAIPKHKKINVAFTNATVNEALEKTLKQLPIHYDINDHSITIRYKKGKEQVADVLIRIRGTVTDTLGQAIMGVSIVNKESNVSTSSNAQGAFELDADEGDILLFTSIGYQRQEVRVGREQQLRIVLKQEETAMEQVVVTALGIRQSVRALTYNVQGFKAEEVTRNKDANFVNALTGKIAGVTINASSSGVGGATRVVMRGTKSIAGNNNALYVIDGIPIPNNNGGQSEGPFAGPVSGEGIASFNPEDIETITALTGPSATALYGNQGANGVLLVTTKKGKVGKIRINLSHSSDFFSPFVMPRFQNTYGQANRDEYASWGPKLAEPSSYRPRDFFQTGFNVFNSVSVSGGTEKSQTLFSAGSNNAEGIIRNNTFNRYNFALRHNTQLTERLTADFSAMYVKLNDNNMVAQGQYHNPIVPIYLFPPGDNFNTYKVYSRYNPGRLLNTQFWPYRDQGLSMQNPYWITDAQQAGNNIDRYMMSVTTNYKVFDWLDVTGRVRIDNSLTQSETIRPASTSGLFASDFGFYSTNKTSNKNTYLDLIANIRKNISDRISFRANVGGSYQHDAMDGLGAGGNLTTLANYYSVQENTSNPPTQTYLRTELQSVFATAHFGYDNWLFMDLTGRYEWPSQLPPGVATTSSYFYPSVGVSGVLSDKWNVSPDVISFAKVRFSYAEVGNPPRFGIANAVYQTIDTRFRPAPFPDYLPERTRSYEAGIELRFLRDRLSLNATVYQSNTTDQLLQQPTIASGIFTDFFYNAGDIRNRGVEATLSHQGEFGKLNWTSGLVFSLNRNRIMRLSDGFLNPATGEPYVNEQRLVSGLGDFQNVLTVGGTMADFYISRVLREDNQGNLWINPVDGSIGQTTLLDRRYIGRGIPDFTFGWNNQFSYKGIDLSFLIDARVGGVGVSYTQAIMDGFGVSEQSAIDRDNGGVMVYGTRYPNVQGYYNLLGMGADGMAGYYIYSATNVRLREAAIGYTIPRKWLNDKGPELRVSVTGRNLFMFYNKSPFDPETTASTGTYGQGIDYFRQPSYRTFGFSIRAQF
ncbi:SusC/RagA family TonB-linked outer membrane protein [Sphingobacterium paludis]|uniref:TonB-linked SusC/RagA family outer membrane protein n=1 Tax=Sphingobacterium paludis TaxID=1476465 RepID=A0A4V3E2L0_9SPHI|nr:SusC/RagA family TonB-linked outer membrane protein [Sphingobacterium paludis]TDS17578.1 TonB-linked SusC/RagA family outer membrane protein [Sphingobacterium paludis]